MGVQVTAQARCPECNYLHDLTIDLGMIPEPKVVPCASELCRKLFALQVILPTTVGVRTWRMIPPNVVEGEGGHEQTVDEATGAYAHDPEAQARAEREAGAEAAAAADAWRGRFG